MGFNYIAPYALKGFLLKRQRQTSFFESKSEHSSSRISHGGDQIKGRRKIYRPLNPKKPLHVIFKSSHAKGRLSLRGKNQIATQKIVESTASKHGIKLHRFINVGNHLHIFASFKKREDMQVFLRIVGGLTARLATGARKGKAFGKRFWDFLVFTRIITGRRDVMTMHKYMNKNDVEVELGGAFRYAMELHEKAVREAKKRRCSLQEVMDRWLHEMVGTQS